MEEAARTTAVVVVANQSAATTVTTTSTDRGTPRKRRLSRKEQRVRKKQKRQQRRTLPLSLSSSTITTSTTVQQSSMSNIIQKKDAPAPFASDTTTTTSTSETMMNMIMANYKPVPIPTLNQDDVNDCNEDEDSRTLGKWFPKAKVIKSAVSYSNDGNRHGHDICKTGRSASPTCTPATTTHHDDNPAKTATTTTTTTCVSSTTPKPTASLLLFYQYVSPQWSQAKVSQLMAYLTRIAQTRQTLGGRIRVAQEGVNATISSVDDGVCNHDDTMDNYGSSRQQHACLSAATRTLHYVCQDLKRFDSRAFCNTDFKFIVNQPPDRHFASLKLLPVRELVFYGFSPQHNIEASATQAQGQGQQGGGGGGGTHVEASEFHKLLQNENDDTVVVDVRNHYEAAIGRFDGGRAQYIDPKMRKSTDYKRWLTKPETQQQLKGKRVLMYCTGGVRCERASAHLNMQMGSDVKGVYQLKGGIERYLQQFPNGGYWRGKNYVFDKREAVSADNPEGDGGVVRKNASCANQNVDTRCILCDKPWDRYIGKKHCQMCGVPVLVCATCLSNKSALENTVIRCPLCVEENITVPADELQYTKNGEAVCADASESAAFAPSVLKWGGGHASKKKKARRLKRKPCRFGAECVRKDCFFAHPDRG